MHPAIKRIPHQGVVPPVSPPRVIGIAHDDIDAALAVIVEVLTHRLRVLVVVGCRREHKQIDIAVLARRAVGVAAEEDDRLDLGEGSGDVVGKPLDVGTSDHAHIVSARAGSLRLPGAGVRLRVSARAGAGTCRGAVGSRLLGACGVGGRRQSPAALCKLIALAMPSVIHDSMVRQAMSSSGSSLSTCSGLNRPST